MTLGKSSFFFHINFSLFLFYSYVRYRNLHTILPTHIVSTLDNSPRLSKTNLQLKRPKSSSPSSDSDIDSKAKRPKVEETNESSSSPKTNLDSL